MRILTIRYLIIIFMEFTKEKTNIAKGVAISLMLISHLYAFPDRLLNGNYYIPTINAFF